MIEYVVRISKSLSRTFTNKDDAIKYAVDIHNNGYEGYAKPGDIIKVFEQTTKLIKEV